MKERELADRFSLEIDNHVQGVQRVQQVDCPEYNELLILGKKLVDEDFSMESNKKNIVNKAFKNLDKDKGENIMKLTNRKGLTTLVASLAVVCVITTSLATTAFGKDLTERILKTISLGHIKAVQVDPVEKQAFEGKVLDKEGNFLGHFSNEEIGKLRTADGKAVNLQDGSYIFLYNMDGKELKMEVTLRDGKYTGVDEKGIYYAWSSNEKENEQGLKALDIKKDGVLAVKNSDPQELNKYTCFDVKLPSYLPTGYSFYKADFYKDEQGQVKDSKYIDLYFANEKTGKYIFMQQRAADEETGFEMGMTETMEEIEINGVKAIIDDSMISWEANDTLYVLNGGGELSKSELIKMAESIK